PSIEMDEVPPEQPELAQSHQGQLREGGQLTERGWHGVENSALLGGLEPAHAGLVLGGEGPSGKRIAGSTRRSRARKVRRSRFTVAGLIPALRRAERNAKISCSPKCSSGRSSAAGKTASTTRAVCAAR